MNTFGFKFRFLMAAAVAAGLVASPGFAQPVPQPAAPDQVVRVQSDCYALGQQVAEQQGGTLARASQSMQSGQPVCVIVVLVPGKDGQRPRRQEFVVPQG